MRSLRLVISVSDLETIYNRYVHNEHVLQMTHLAHFYGKLRTISYIQCVSYFQLNIALYLSLILIFILILTLTLCQALEVVRKLRDVMPIARAGMSLRIICPISKLDEMKEFLSENSINIENQSGRKKEGEKEGAKEGEKEGEKEGREKDFLLEAGRLETVSLDLVIDPELFRKIEEAVASVTKGALCLEVP